MRTICMLLLTLLIGGCSAVDIVDSKERAALQSVGFEQHQLMLKEGGELNYWQVTDSWFWWFSGIELAAGNA